MKYSIINNNPLNFKVEYEIDGQKQTAHFQADSTRYGSVIPGSSWVRIARHRTITINTYGTIMGDGQTVTHHHMSEEELFQESTVDALAIQKQYAGLLLEAFYNNGNEMTEELLELILNPIPLAKTKKSKKS